MATTYDQFTSAVNAMSDADLIKALRDQTYNPSALPTGNSSAPTSFSTWEQARAYDSLMRQKMFTTNPDGSQTFNPQYADIVPVRMGVQGQEAGVVGVGGQGSLIDPSAIRYDKNLGTWVTDRSNMQEPTPPSFFSQIAPLLGIGALAMGAGFANGMFGGGSAAVNGAVNAAGLTGDSTALNIMSGAGIDTSGVAGVAGSVAGQGTIPASAFGPVNPSDAFNILNAPPVGTEVIPATDVGTAGLTSGGMPIYNPYTPNTLPLDQLGSAIPPGTMPTGPSGSPPGGQPSGQSGTPSTTTPPGSTSGLPLGLTPSQIGSILSGVANTVASQNQAGNIQGAAGQVAGASTQAGNLLSQAALQAAGLQSGAATQAAGTIATGATGAAGLTSGAATTAGANLSAADLQAAGIMSGGYQTAAGQQVAAYQKALQEAQNVLQQQQVNQQPYMTAGTQALDTLSAGLQPGGQFNRAFTMADAQNMPAYQFALQQGTQAINNAAAAGGLQLSSANIQNLGTFAEGTAAQYEQQAFNQWMAQNNLSLGALQNMVQTGQVSTQQLQQALQQYGVSAETLNANIGQAQAAGTMGAASAQAGGVLSSTQAQEAARIAAANAQAAGMTQAAGATAAGQIGSANAQAGGITQSANAQASGMIGAANAQAGGRIQAGNITSQAIPNLVNTVGGVLLNQISSPGTTTPQQTTQPQTSYTGPNTQSVVYQGDPWSMPGNSVPVSSVVSPSIYGMSDQIGMFQGANNPPPALTAVSNPIPMSGQTSIFNPTTSIKA